MNNIFQNPEIHHVEKILKRNNLPVDDIPAMELHHFFGCGETTDPQGVIGLEVYGSDGLLRSFAVNDEVRGKGCGSDLLHQLEQHSKISGIKSLYLLTETAEDYFTRKGFKKFSRNLAPETIKHSREFNGLCPDSATLMRKVIAE